MTLPARTGGGPGMTRPRAEYTAAAVHQAVQDRLRLGRGQREALEHGAVDGLDVVVNAVRGVRRESLDGCWPVREELTAEQRVRFGHAGEGSARRGRCGVWLAGHVRRGGNSCEVTSRVARAPLA